MMITVNLTPRQQAGLDAACAAFNILRDPAARLTTEQYIAMLGDSCADSHAVGKITVWEFTNRFLIEGVLDAIKAASVTDEQIAGYLAILADKGKSGNDPMVNLYSETFIGGLQYLQSKNLITADQAVRISAVV